MVGRIPTNPAPRSRKSSEDHGALLARAGERAALLAAAVVAAALAVALVATPRTAGAQEEGCEVSGFIECEEATQNFGRDGTPEEAIA